MLGNGQNDKTSVAGWYVSIHNLSFPCTVSVFVDFRFRKCDISLRKEEKTYKAEREAVLSLYL
jgi:hypothetical protein